MDAISAFEHSSESSGPDEPSSTGDNGRQQLTWRSHTNLGERRNNGAGRRQGRAQGGARSSPASLVAGERASEPLISLGLEMYRHYHGNKASRPL